MYLLKNYIDIKIGYLLNNYVDKGINYLLFVFCLCLKQESFLPCRELCFYPGVFLNGEATRLIRNLFSFGSHRPDHSRDSDLKTRVSLFATGISPYYPHKGYGWQRFYGKLGGIFDGPTSIAKGSDGMLYIQTGAITEL